MKGDLKDIPPCSHPGCRAKGSFGDRRLHYCRAHLPAGFLPGTAAPAAPAAPVAALELQVPQRSLL